MTKRVSYACDVPHCDTPAIARFSHFSLPAEQDRMQMYEVQQPSYFNGIDVCLEHMEQLEIHDGWFVIVQDARWKGVKEALR